MSKQEPKFGPPTRIPRTRVTRTYCPPCLNSHSSECYALRDSENDCECRCNSGIPNLKGKTQPKSNRYIGRHQKAMSNTWQQAAVTLGLGLSGLILFISAACTATSTPAPPNTPGTEVNIRAGSQATLTATPTPTPVPKAASEKAKEIPATVSGRPDPSESIRLENETGDDDQALPIPDRRELNYPNLGSRLDGLVASVEAGQATAQEAAADTPVHSGESVAVTVYLTSNVDAVVAFLEENGGDPRNVGQDYVEAYVPVTLLGPLSERPGVIRVREIVPPEPAQNG